MKHPIDQFQAWLEDAIRAGVDDPAAMALATTDAQGMPNVRMVLLKWADETGFVFYTNLESPKAAELRATQFAALCFHWPEARRQVRVRGKVEPVSDAEADDEFATWARPRQIGTWASRQSRPMSHARELELNCAAVALRSGANAVARPPFWSGFRVVPEQIEFWSERPFRRHERRLCTRSDSEWREQALFP